MALLEKGSPRTWMHRHASLPLLISVLAIFAVEIHPVRAQQQYNNVSGYACTGVQPRCLAYAYYRTQEANATLNSTAALFNTSAANIVAANTNLSSVPATTPLANGSALYIPLDCSCLNNTYQAPTTKVVQAGDTMYNISIITFQALVTYQAIGAANPSIIPETMPVNTILRIPIRCACPTVRQQTDGIKSLLTYPIFPNEELSAIAKKFGHTEEELQVANTLPNSTIAAYTTLLVPQGTSTPGGNAGGPGSAPAPSAASRASQAHWLYSVSLLGVQSLLLLLLFYHAK
ncbi:lysM domain receptor-like kinase 4 [Physcomitrium patens]|uniref:LysM domain-containing protein n=1 Tax=Physcomitrium patens TaxID=3218 RepID=A0A2K1K297_PHYPA|nr:protein LYK5-like [Physcomitrium patens]XP_024385485.1 protein LYK5-like [Physcomitrium patens]XP_024385486.1 protein LYK5-like [Physcomitrium patens]XP_024385487.1 protein LYK5-like [Physcomitrium patens]XP_024385488.1 protein LYK5-like [Physcomitrium patens]PNR47892.1 hypothetical protein PHYPA_012365 [Physcomitrium patens]|eukprot:XP_024385484.1 protein LYK5-like [Physcomitrella patens]